MRQVRRMIDSFIMCACMCMRYLVAFIFRAGNFMFAVESDDFLFFFFCFLFVCHHFRSNPINADVLYLSDKKRFASSHFNQSNALIIYLHGFSERVPGGAGQSSQEIRDGNNQ